MSTIKCFKKGCNREVQYVCSCTISENCSCEKHLKKHLELPCQDHDYNSIFLDPYEETKKAILSLLEKEKLKIGKSKIKLLDSCSQLLKSAVNIQNESLKKIDLDSSKICFWIERISQAQKISKFEQDPILNLLTLDPEDAAKTYKAIISDHSAPEKSFTNFLYIFRDEIDKLIECSIKDNIKAIQDKRLLKIKNRIEDHVKHLNNKLEEINDSIYQIMDESEYTQRWFENKRQKTNDKIKKIAKSLDSQNNSIQEDFDSQNNSMQDFDSQSNSIQDFDSQKDSIQENLELKINENQILTLQDWQAKMQYILNKPNSPETEREFEVVKKFYERSPSKKSLEKDYKKFLEYYQHKTNLYLLSDHFDGRTKLYIYNRWGLNEERIIDTPESLDASACLTQLPNGDLFCYGSDNHCSSGITFIIDKNFRHRVLPPGIPCLQSSCIYFNNNVYCFGGKYYWGSNRDWKSKNLSLSSKFDLNENRWINLAPMPVEDYGCQSVIFNENILISGNSNRNLLLYSIETNSFSTIPRKFGGKTTKILINVERLYLIEDDGNIYESENGYDWEQVSNSIMKSNSRQIYCCYYQGEILIAGSRSAYFRFNLSTKKMVKLEIRGKESD